MTCRLFGGEKPLVTETSRSESVVGGSMPFTVDLALLIPVQCAMLENIYWALGT